MILPKSLIAFISFFLLGAMCGSDIRVLAFSKPVKIEAGMAEKESQMTEMLNEDMFRAIGLNDKDQVQMLLEKGASPDGVPGKSPVALSVRATGLEILSLLLASGGDPNGLLGTEPAVYLAAFHGRIEAIDLLLAAGADINKPNDIGRTPLIAAAAADQWEAVKHLISKGAPVLMAQPNGLFLGHYVSDHLFRPGTYSARTADELMAYIESQGVSNPPPSPQTIAQLIQQGKWPVSRP